MKHIIFLFLCVFAPLLCAMEPQERPNEQQPNSHNTSLVNVGDIESQPPYIYVRTDIAPPGQVVIELHELPITHSNGNSQGAIYKFLIPASAAAATVFLDYFFPQVSFLAYGAFGTGIKTSLREASWKAKVFILAVMFGLGYVIDKVLLPEFFGSQGQISLALAVSALVIVMKRSITEFIKRQNAHNAAQNNAQLDDDSDDDEEEPKKKEKKKKKNKDKKPEEKKEN